MCVLTTLSIPPPPVDPALRSNLAACRISRKMVQRYDFCPVEQHFYIARWYVQRPILVLPLRSRFQLSTIQAEGGVRVRHSQAPSGPRERRCGRQRTERVVLPHLLSRPRAKSFATCRLLQVSACLPLLFPWLASCRVRDTCCCDCMD